MTTEMPGAAASSSAGGEPQAHASVRQSWPLLESVSRVFTPSDQAAFAQLSGDRNPMHIDPALARRMLFGAPVVHGVHVLLWALEHLCTGLTGPHKLDSLKVAFETPVLVEDEAVLSIDANSAGILRAVVRVRGKIAARITVALSDRSWAGASPADKEPVCVCRDTRPDELADRSGAIALEVSAEVLARQFPLAAAILPRGQIAILLASTRLVGMECPGLRSIYSALALRFSDSAARSSALNYRTTNFDERFSLVQMALSCDGVTGEAAAFVRPAIRNQSAFGDTARLVSPGRFAGVHALIVGGSRGLGEATANLIAAGGGNVTVTYNLGRDDAQRVVTAIRDGGGQASALRYDLHAALPDEIPAPPYTHCFFYASPKIRASAGAFDESLFRNFCRYYLAGALECLEWFASRSGKEGTFVYPSSVYVSTVPAGFAEYTAAKAAGEVACHEAIQRYRKMKLFAPRLPRLMTDQTASLRDSDDEDPAAAIASLLMEIIPPRA
jgi:acyl dehydratase